MVTTAKRNHADNTTIRQARGHTSDLTLDKYIEEANLFVVPASGYLGL